MGNSPCDTFSLSAIYRIHSKFAVKLSSITVIMDTLDDSEWDVLIAGTGIQQSLLALCMIKRALSL